VHANHVDVIPELRDLFPDGHDLIERPHALPGFEVSEVLVDFLKAGVEVLHGTVVAADGIAVGLAVDGSRDLSKAFVVPLLLAAAFANLFGEVGVGLDEVSLGSDDDARGCFGMEGTLREMLCQLAPFNAHRTTEVLVCASNLDTVTVQVVVRRHIGSEDHLPASFASCLGLRAGNQMQLTIWLQNFLLAELAIRLHVLTLFAGRLATQLLVARLVGAAVFSETTFSSCVRFDILPAHLLVATPLSKWTLDHQAVQLCANQPRAAEAVTPREWLSINGTSGSRWTGSNTPSQAAVAKGMITRRCYRIHQRVVANRTQQRLIWLGHVVECVHVKNGITTVLGRDIQARLMW